MRRLPRIAAIGGAAMALAGSAYAADQITGRDRAPASAVVTIASTAPLFQEQGLVTGQSFERCTVLTNEGPQPADVTLFGRSAQADLSPWLDLELVRGALPDGTPAGDCTGFVPDADDYGAGPGGVVFRGTLDTLPGEESGIADPTRWAVGERHAYLLRIDYTGDNPQQGLQTVQSFNWGATPFDDRPPDPFLDPGTQPVPTTSRPDGGTGAAAAAAPPESIPIGRQCKVVTFPTRSYIGARAISRPKKVKKAKAKAKAKKSVIAEVGSTEDSVISAGEDLATIDDTEVARREALLAYTRRTGARRTPVLVVRLSPSKKGETLAVRVGLRKNGQMTSPKRWRWVRIRVNSTPAKSTLKWPFTASARMTQLKLGYNQIDLTLNRGGTKQRIKGLPSLMRRSFAFIVSQPTGTTGGGSDCTLG